MKQIKTTFIKYILISFRIVFRIKKKNTGRQYWNFISNLDSQSYSYQNAI